ncbi:MAG: ORF6N domain-containing protein [Daejeonella sp.]|nr:ORF6N domain-containing protein [Daejeonella sp.]MDP2415494.1 ORF6N domain-containing protein [Daejeonella sp.]
MYEIRGQKVMLDSDLAELYGVKTRILNQALKRNTDRFPSDFMFQITEQEWEALRSHFVISKPGRGGRQYLPNVFTEHGVLMLSSVLNNPIAIQVNIQLVRIFTRLRRVIAENHELKLEIEEIKNKLSNQGKDIALVFNYLDELVDRKEKPESRKRIGYMPDEL